MQESIITVVGTAVQDPKFSITKNGVAFCSVRIAVNGRKFDRESGSWQDGDTNYFTLNCWRFLAENTAQSVQKGDPIMATGRLRVREWKTEEKSGTSVEIEATSLGHDLTRGTATFARSRKPKDDVWSEPEVPLAS